MNEYLTQAPWLESDYETTILPLRFASSIGDIGRPRLGKIAKLFALWKELAATCRRLRPSLAYFTLAPTGAAFWRDLTLVALLRSFRIPIAFHIHGKGMGSGGIFGLRRAFYRWVFKKSVVIQLSPELYDELKGIVPRSLSRIVPNGIPDMFNAGGSPRRVSAGDPIRVLFLSTMLREKGIFELLEAIAILRREGIGIRGTYVGPFQADRVRDEFLRAIADLNVYEVVRWEGPAYGEARRRYLITSDVFAFPSYYGPEAFPLAVLEAMAASLPVVGARTGAIPSIIDEGRTGLVVPSREPKALAAALRSLACDPTTREQMAIAGRAKYVREYTLDRFLARMRSVIAESAGGAAIQDVNPLIPADSAGDEDMNHSPRTKVGS